MEYVYRYISVEGDVLYVGITNNMARRVAQHKRDKLAKLKNASIQYFPVKYRADAELIESYLICKQDDPKYNVSKTAKGSASFLDKITFPWIPYDGTATGSRG